MKKPEEMSFEELTQLVIKDEEKIIEWRKNVTNMINAQSRIIQALVNKILVEEAVS